MAARACLRSGRRCSRRSKFQRQPGLAILRHQIDAAVDGVARQRGERSPRGSPCRRGAHRPKTARASSVRPEPTRPARPDLAARMEG
jgi:hypothetical protein